MRKRQLWKSLTAAALAAVLVMGCGGSAGSSAGTQAPAEAAEETAEEEAPAEETAQAEAPAEETAQAETPAESKEVDESSAANLKTADSQLDFSFVLDGVTYSIPANINDFIDNGWTVEADLETEIGGYTYAWCDISKQNDNYDDITIDLFNGSGNTKKAADCSVASIEVRSRVLRTYDFALSNGLKPGDSMETVEQVMGTPTDTSDGTSSLTYYYGKDRETGRIAFTWYKEDGKLTDEALISISLFTTEETVSSTEVPEYLSEYTAPAAMGADFDSGTFKLDGVVYRLSCPVSELVKNGWVVTNDDDVMADRTGYIDLEKNGVEITAHVRNYANYQTIGSNCAVYKISCYYYPATDSVPDLELADGLSFKSDLNKLNSLTGAAGFEKDESDSRVSYSYYNYDTGTSVYIYYDKETKAITSLSYERNVWP